MRLLFSGATVHGFPVIRTDQPSRFGTQVIRGSADKKSSCFLTGNRNRHPYCCWWWWRKVSRGSDKNLRFFFWRRQWQVGEKGSTQFKVQSLKLHNESQKHKTCRDRCITRSSQPLPTSFNRIDESNRSAENEEMIIKFNTDYKITKEELPFTKKKYGAT